MIIFKILMLVIILAFVAGQARLTLRSLQSGKAGWGRYEGHRETSPILFQAWLAFYVTAMIIAILYAFAAVMVMFL